MSNIKKTKTSAAIWCWLLGPVGGHKFYLNKTSSGIMYLVFCWTLVPVFLSIIDLITFLTISEDDFNKKYNSLSNNKDNEIEDNKTGIVKINKKLVLAFFGIPLLILGLLGFFNSTPKDNKELNIRATSSDPTVKPTLKTWNIYKNTDEMSNSKKVSASLESDNYVNFSFPYGGKQKGTLTLRKINNKYKAATLSIMKGQFMCSTGCKTKVKFGDRSPVTYNMSGPSDYSSEIIFFNSRSAFVSNLKKNKKVLIEVTIYNEGQQRFSFSWDELNI